jgi:hypothetical protein
MLTPRTTVQTTLRHIAVFATMFAVLSGGPVLLAGTPDGTVLPEPIQRALAHFAAGELETMPRIVPATVKPAGASGRHTEGFVVGRYPVIYISTWSDVYKAAEAGDRIAIMRLAGVIAHERVHVEQGLDAEQAAYDAEIFQLRRTSAPSSVIDGIRRAAQSVLKSR